VFDIFGALYFEGILVIKYLSVVVFNMLGAMDFEGRKIMFLYSYRALSCPSPILLALCNPPRLSIVSYDSRPSKTATPLFVPPNVQQTDIFVKGSLEAETCLSIDLQLITVRIEPSIACW
jgi:hypothetical protein